MPTETYLAGADFIVPDAVFSVSVELEGEAGQDSANPGGNGGRVVGGVRPRVFDINP